MRKELGNIFSILKTGTQSETKEAKRKIEKLRHNDRKRFERNAHIALEQIKDFDSIQDPKNKAAFISGLSIFFLILSDKYFTELKNFVLKTICHQNGHVRESIRKTADWLYISLSSRINPFVYPKGKKLTQKQIAEQQKAKEEYAGYLKDLELLMEKYDDGSYDSIVYIDEMKPSIFKSLQMLWGDLTRGNLPMQLHISTKEVTVRRKEIELRLMSLLKAN
ncbi:MAG: hypothetical protein V1697_01915 [Candidatus Levyibacteriota bacterium]